MSLRRAWEEHASDWVRWARTPGHDSYWRFHGRRFMELVPPAGRLTVDVGCGEGRLGRDLVAQGHRVVGFDASPRLVRALASHEAHYPVAVADAAWAPLRSGCADLVVAFMSLQDIDDFEAAVTEASRLLPAGGRLCVAIVHPVNSAGAFEGDGPGAPFVVRGSYLGTFAYADDIERDGLTMRFASAHRPLEAYSRALEDAGFAIEAIREVTEEDPEDRWARIPMFLHVRAVKT